jgi:hypothetical protein
MRNRRLTSFAVALIAALAVAGPGSAQPAPASPPVAAAPAPPEVPPPAIQTPGRNSTASIPNAVEAPVYDLNIVRQPIPPILLAAITNPYDPPNPRTCAEVARQVYVLQGILGADLGEPDTPQSPSLTLRNGRIALALLHGAAESLLPFAGFVRTLSGAGHHDELIVEAITAGSVRRGYLKGMGEVMGCPPPASPSHFLRPPPPAHEDGPKPQYPIN